MSRDSTGAEDRVVIPTLIGEDIFSSNGQYDGHVRVEHYRGLGTKVYVDLFDSSIQVAVEAHIVSESFDYSAKGAEEANDFLNTNGFGVKLKIAD